MEQDFKDIIYEFDTGYCKTKNKAIKKIDFDEINNILDKTDYIRDIKAEVEDLVDFIGCITNKKGEVSDKGILVIRNDNGWRIQISIY
ncbi:MAG: hypothetical protein J1F35_06205 [Erysipelotrichales bacterium]|nr:hypothetical protein [Erysipelotrichales bacterium]